VSGMFSIDIDIENLAKQNELSRITSKKHLPRAYYILPPSRLSINIGVQV